MDVDPDTARADGAKASSALADRAAACDIVVAYAMALDARDWSRFRGLFEDTAAIDYSSLGSIQGSIAADDWTSRCKVLGEFDATQHKVTNFVCVIDGDRALVTSYVDAAHFIRSGGRVLEAYALGTYVHTLNRTAGGWRIAECVFRLSGHPGGRAAFDEAFGVAREAFAARSGR